MSEFEYKQTTPICIRCAEWIEGEIYDGLIKSEEKPILSAPCSVCRKLTLDRYVIEMRELLQLAYNRGYGDGH
jgi:hypothetical protein